MPWDLAPCEHPEHWAHQVASETLPLLVHHRAAWQAAMAAEVVASLEAAWRVETDALRFSAPLGDDGDCGPDGRFDVFLWQGQQSAWVEAISDEPATAWDDWRTFMVTDPWGPYGGAALHPTLAHELNHACQAADDWWDVAFIYEATATFVEAVVHPEDVSWSYVLHDFQGRPEWSIDRDDGYETWFMYGAALYLHYLRAEHFAGDAGFVGDLWAAMRSPPGDNEPDFADALDAVLPDGSFVDTVAPFARWRWAPPPPLDVAAVALSADVPAKQSMVVIDPGPMLLGSAYVRITGAPGATLDAAVDGDDAVSWVLQTVDGPPAPPLALGADGTLVLVVTALPTGPYDPDERTDDRYGVTLLLDY